MNISKTLVGMAFLALSYDISAATISSAAFEDTYIGGGATNSGNTDRYGWDALHGDLLPNHEDNMYNNKSLEARIFEKNGKTWLKVIIDSTFAGTNSNYDYGDLFIMDGDNYTSVSEADSKNEVSKKVSGANGASLFESSNKWEYAYNLDDRGTNGSNFKKNGQLLGLDTSDNYIDQFNIRSGSNYGRNGQIISTNQTNSNLLNTRGKWGANQSSSKVWFKMDITNVDTLMNAKSLAFRWTMSCANDIIEGVAKVSARTSVPEPSTMLLMLAGIGGLAMRKKKML